MHPRNPASVKNVKMQDFEDASFATGPCLILTTAGGASQAPTNGFDRVAIEMLKIC